MPSELMLYVIEWGDVQHPRADVARRTRRPLVRHVFIVMDETYQNPKEDTVNEHHRNTLSRRRFLRSLGTGAAASALLAACGQAPAAPSAAQPTASGAAQPAAPAAASGGAGEVQFWDMVWGPPEYIDTAKKLVDQFNQANPNIKVTYQSTAWSGWPQVFTTAIGSGTAPDISTGGGYQAVQFYPQGAILEVDDVITSLQSAGKLNDFLPGTVDRLQFDGHHIALPWAIDIRLPYYRKDLFDKAGTKMPTNWEELRAAAKALTSGDQYGIAFPAAPGAVGWQAFFAFLLNNGGGFFASDGKVDVMNERNVETFTFLANLVKDGSVHPGSAGFSGDDGNKAFGSGKAAMIIAGPGFEQRFPDQKDNIGLMAPLSGPHGDKGALSWVNNIMLYKQTKNPDATKAFLTWWSENQKPLWTEGHNGQIPTRTSIANDPYFQNNAMTKQVLEQWIPIGQSAGSKAPGVFPALNDFEGGGVLQTLTTDILQGMDANAALQKAEAGVKTIVKQ
jgi:multiple sugar transport system substrate-binding protein